MDSDNGVGQLDGQRLIGLVFDQDIALFRVFEDQLSCERSVLDALKQSDLFGIRIEFRLGDGSDSSGACGGGKCLCNAEDSHKCRDGELDELLGGDTRHHVSTPEAGPECFPNRIPQMRKAPTKKGVCAGKLTGRSLQGGGIAGVRPVVSDGPSESIGDSSAAGHGVLELIGSQ